jgi:glycosyltransferase involved in cell wall biosynthesis
MKVLMQIRKDVDTYPGGDFIQLLKTKEHLEKSGVSVDLSFSYQERLKSYDLVHLFNVTRITDTYLFFKNAKSQGKKIVLSPIYHSLKDMEDFYRYYYRFPYLNIVMYLALKEFYYPLRGKTTLSLKSIFQYKQTVRTILTQSDILLPNSFLELETLEKELGVRNRYQVVPNATEVGTICFHSEYHKENLILCIGRIEPRKNVLNVIRAFKKVITKLPEDTELIFIGTINESHKSYRKQFLKYVREDENNIKYIGSLSHQEVLTYLKRARLLVLASFFETTGLVGLEALACQANIVISERGYTKEYFRDNAEFCDPYSVDSIEKAIEKGFSKEAPERISKHFLDNYTWSNTATLTLSAYRNL